MAAHPIDMSVLSDNQSVAYDATHQSESINYEITPVVAPLVDAQYGTSESCAGFEIIWANGANEIRGIAIGTNGSVLTASGGSVIEKEISGSKTFTGAEFVRRPSCVSAYWYQPGYAQYEGMFLSGDFRNRVHVVWEEEDVTHAPDIVGTETDYNTAGGMPKIDVLDVVDYEADFSGCPWVSVVQTPAAGKFWQLSSLLPADWMKAPVGDCHFVASDNHDPCISLDAYGRQRVVWRLNGSCSNDASQKFSAVAAFQGGPAAPYQTSSYLCGGILYPGIWIPDNGPAPNSQWNSGHPWVNSYTNAKGWAWLTSLSTTGTNLVTSPTVTSAIKLSVNSKDSVEVVWQTNEGGSATQNARVADDVNDDGVFSNVASGELAQASFGTASDLRQGADPNLALGASLARDHAGFVLTGSDCASNQIADFQSRHFNPVPLKPATGSQISEVFGVRGVFSVQFWNLVVANLPQAVSVRRVSESAMSLGSFVLEHGQMIKLDFSARNQSPNKKLIVLLVHEDGAKEVLATIEPGCEAVRPLIFSSSKTESVEVQIEIPSAASVIPIMALEAPEPLNSEKPDASVSRPRSLSIVPNPFRSSFVIEAPASVGPSTLEVVNALGQVVTTIYRDRVLLGSSTFEVEGNWPAGIYYARMVDAEGTVSAKILKEEQR